MGGLTLTCESSLVSGAVFSLGQVSPRFSQKEVIIYAHSGSWVDGTSCFTSELHCNVFPGRWCSFNSTQRYGRTVQSSKQAHPGFYFVSSHLGSIGLEKKRGTSKSLELPIR
ncbi:Hypothetical predicted protein [Podarcis lilfordi]|uniref:Uncharacterized protein n=1 Tax=Podarcis lilfordi TaxID=74358 RepID=A0AA35KBL9_9SAUR|nr:Hypothetical predicted protein [Podarcis lilfordi]